MRIQAGSLSAKGLERTSSFAALAAIASLPWSTSATGIFIALWLGLFLFLVDWRDWLNEVGKPRSLYALMVLSISLVALFWSMGTARDCQGALSAVGKFAALPFIILYFRKDRRLAARAMAIFLISLTCLLAVSWISYFLRLGPSRIFSMLDRGVPVKDWIAQTSFFLMAAFFLAHLALNALQEGRAAKALGTAGLGLLFLANTAVIHTSRTGLVVAPVLILLFVIQCFGIKRGALAGLVLAILASVLLWTSSTQIRDRLATAFSEVQQYEESREANSAGYRLEWYRQSAGLVAAAPVLGYGLGSIRAVLDKAARESQMPEIFATANPHNQFLWMALQTGLVGTCALLAMWAAHAFAFASTSLAARLGLGLVVQNIVSSLFNSHLTDFTQGWTYMIGTGIALAASSYQEYAAQAEDRAGRVGGESAAA